MRIEGEPNPEQYTGLTPERLTVELRSLLDAIPVWMFADMSQDEFFQIEADEWIYSIGLKQDMERRAKSAYSKILLERFQLLRNMFVGTPTFSVWADQKFRLEVAKGVEPPIKDNPENPLHLLGCYGPEFSTSVFSKTTTAKEIERRCYRSFLDEHFDDAAVRSALEEVNGPALDIPIVADEALLKVRKEFSEERDETPRLLRTWRREFIEYWEDEP